MNIILHKLQTIQCDTYVHHFCFALIEWVALKWGRGGEGWDKFLNKYFSRWGSFFSGFSKYFPCRNDRYVLKVSAVRCQSILLISTLNQHLKQYLIDTLIDTQSTLCQHLTISQSTKSAKCQLTHVS